jgi:hypothetical protein
VLIQIAVEIGFLHRFALFPLDSTSSRATIV